MLYVFFSHIGMCFFIQSFVVYGFYVPEANRHEKIWVRTRIIVEKRGGIFTWCLEYVWKWNQVLLTSGKMHCKALSFWVGQETLGFLVEVLEFYWARIKLMSWIWTKISGSNHFLNMFLYALTLQLEISLQNTVSFILMYDDVCPF